MLTFFHCYTEDLWQGYEKNGFLKGKFGIRLPHAIGFPEEEQFHQIARVGGKLYEYIKEHRCPFYIDRLLGGTYIYDYPFDPALIQAYEDLLGDDFFGFQMHEWLSNYRADVVYKLKTLSKEEWTKENIERTIREKYPYPHLFLEAMTAQEMADCGKPENPQQLCDNMTALYLKRAQTVGKLVAVDSYYMMFPFEAKNGVSMIMPELGSTLDDIRLQMCYARGVARAYGRKLGAYYEPWGGHPFSSCFYCKGDRNEWHLNNENFPFKTAGENGGGSRSIQWRIFLYAYLSNAEAISEEWGGYNTFTDLETYTLSEYGKVKKRFFDFLEQYPDVGEKLAPVAAVHANDLLCYTLEEAPDKLFGFPLEGEEKEKMYALKNGVRYLFSRAVDMVGDETECRAFINSEVPDAVDFLDEGDGHALANYQYLVNLTGDDDFAKRYPNCIDVEDVEEKLHELLPCRVTGGLHYVVNRRGENGYYLTVFNHAGVVRNTTEGEYILPEATKTVCIELKDGRTLQPLEGGKEITEKNGKYYVTVDGGDFFFASF